MIQPGKVVDIGRVNFVRQVRDRGDLFFVFVLPTMIILALGLQFGGVSPARLGVVAPTGDAAAEALVASLADDGTRFEIRSIADVRDAQGAGGAWRARGGGRHPGRVLGALRGSGTVEAWYLGTTDALTTRAAGAGRGGGRAARRRSPRRPGSPWPRASGLGDGVPAAQVRLRRPCPASRSP